MVLIMRESIVKSERYGHYLPFLSLVLLQGFSWTQHGFSELVL